jgi:hypothetical protein
MRDKDLTGSNKSTKDPVSGLRSANDMVDAIPAKGWGAEEEVSGVDNPAGVSVKTASNKGIDFGGPVGSEPAYHNPNGPSADDTDVSLLMTMNVGEEPKEMTGAGLKTAVGTFVKS